MSFQFNQLSFRINLTGRVLPLSRTVSAEEGRRGPALQCNSAAWLFDLHGPLYQGIGQAIGSPIHTPARNQAALIDRTESGARNTATHRPHQTNATEACA